jgi:DNA-binding NtrC family response regulator
LGETRITLVVDDDCDALRLIIEALRRKGFAVAEAASGSAAIKIVETEKPAVIIADINIPDVDGLDVARYALQCNPETKIILISEYPDALMRAKRANVDVYTIIDKPVSLALLVGFVAMAFGRDHLGLTR